MKKSPESKVSTKAKRKNFRAEILHTERPTSLSRLRLKDARSRVGTKSPVEAGLLDVLAPSSGENRSTQRPEQRSARRNSRRSHGRAAGNRHCQTILGAADPEGTQRRSKWVSCRALSTSERVFGRWAR